MKKRRKLILSRKGFDAANGGMPSPILPDGTLMSLPIPMANEAVTLGDIPAPGDGGTMGDVVHTLSNGRHGRVTPVHLDPDLVRASRGERRSDWRPLFGQAAAAQSHLANQCVGEGDVFLFFGWFRQAEGTLRALRFKPKSDAPDRHVVFGWMQIGEVWDVTAGVPAAFPSWARYHPHVLGRFNGRNVIYAATELLMLPDGTSCGLPGAGALKRFSDACVLTEGGRSRSNWLLPGWFLSTGGPALTYHRDPRRWERVGDRVRLRTVGTGQEFVMEISAVLEPASRWIASLLAGVDRP